MRLVKDLSGYSGCRISLCEKTTEEYPCEYFIRKQCTTTQYNERLVKQISKQSLFTHHGTRTPKVYQTGYIKKNPLLSEDENNEFFYCDMEYVQGKTLGQLIINKEFEKAESAFATVLCYFDETLFPSNNPSQITAKIKDLSVKLKEGNVFNINTELYTSTGDVCHSALKFLKQYHWTVHKHYCHGDLTLENIIVDDKGHIYFIDFLDVFYECIEMDMAKLLQDVYSGWSFRFETLDEEQKAFLRSCCNKISMKYNELTHDTEQQLYSMLILTLARIYPYTLDSNCSTPEIKDLKTKTFLDDNISLLLKNM